MRCINDLFFWTTGRPQKPLVDLRSILVGLCLALAVAGPVYADGQLTPAAGITGGSLANVTAFPLTPATGDVVIVTDDSVTGACDSAAGTAVTTCRFNGTIWEAFGDGNSGTGAPTTAPFITTAPVAGLSAEVPLSALPTGCLSVTTTTGALTSRVLTGTANEITLANGDCSGVPTFSLASILTLTGHTVTLRDSLTTILDDADPTKILSFQLSGLTTGTNPIFTVPNANFTGVIADAGAANNFLTAISAGGVISKAQPAFTNISGSVTDAQVPNTITVDLAAAATALAANGANCSVGEYARGVDASGVAENCTPASGAGTVTATGGALTANSVVLGAGSVDTKVVAGIITDGTSKVTLGVAGASVGSIDLKNATSGTITIAPVTGALGTVTLSAPASTGTLALTNGNVATATALAANGSNCSGNNFALGVDASGVGECAQPAFSNLSGSATDAQVADTITASNYLPLAGGTLTGQLVTDNLGIEFEESNTNPTCAAGNYNIFADTSEAKLKKCTNGVASDLDTTGAGIGGTLGTTDNAIPRADGAGGSTLQASGCTISDTDQMTCAGGFVGGSGSVGILTLLEGTAPGAGTNAGEHNIYIDSADSKLKSHENAGSVVTYFSSANQPGLSADTTGNYLASSTNGAGIAGATTASHGGTITPAFDYTATLAGNPALATGACQFATTGLICEGGTANASETLITLTDPTADRTFTIPDANSNPVIPDAGAANNFLTAISAGGVISKAQPDFTNLSGSATDAQVPDTITASNYLPLAGGTLTGQLVTDNLGVEFDESDTNPACAAGNFSIYADLSENKLKKCTNGSATDLDTTGGTPSFDTITGGTNAAAAMIVGTGASLATSGSGTIVATTGDSATAFFSAGTLEVARGGTGIGAFGTGVATALGNNTNAAGGLSPIDGTATFTGKTYDAEGTGNVLSMPIKRFYPAAGCNNATAGPVWDLPTTLAAVPACVTGTNIQKGVLDFADTGGLLNAQITDALPADWTTTGGLDAIVYWTTTATTGNGKWSVSTICTDVAASATDDPAFNTANTVTTAAPGTASRVQTSAITGLTTTSCTTGTKMLLHLKVARDGGDASDTIGATARFIGMELTFRRAM
jgi:hypothetical protein